LFSSFGSENTKRVLEDFLKLLHPYCPYITEELHEKLGNKRLISLSDWPVAGKVDVSVEKAEESLNSLIEDVNHVIKLVKEREGKDVSKIYLYVIPNELENFDVAVLSKRFGVPVIVYSVSDSKKVDPEGKAKKARPGRPGVYVE
jgi:valyl-tRNA synthetase